MLANIQLFVYHSLSSAWIPRLIILSKKKFEDIFIVASRRQDHLCISNCIWLHGTGRDSSMQDFQMASIGQNECVNWSRVFSIQSLLEPLVGVSLLSFCCSNTTSSWIMCDFCHIGQKTDAITNKTLASSIISLESSLIQSFCRK